MNRAKTTYFTPPEIPDYRQLQFNVRIDPWNKMFDNTIIFAPKSVVDEARVLKNAGYYEKALELLSEHTIGVIYNVDPRKDD